MQRKIDQLRGENRALRKELAEVNAEANELHQNLHHVAAATDVILLNARAVMKASNIKEKPIIDLDLMSRAIAVEIKRNDAPVVQDVPAGASL